MMRTTIYLIRHGESLGNIQHRFLGHCDWDLTDLGLQQAACTAEEFKDIPVDVVVSSDLLRAYHTAEPIAMQKQLQVLKEPGFREIFAGQWEGRLFSELETEFAGDYHVWRQNIGRAVTTGGESVLHLHTRVLNALNRTVQANEGKTIVIATHATPIRVLLTGFSGYPIEETSRIPWVSNASITKLICENGNYTVAFSDKTDHLGKLSTRLPANV